MSAEYIAFINAQEYGPVGFADLKDMWARGEITNDTQVRFSDNPTWASWQAVRTAHLTKQAEQVILVNPSARSYKVKDFSPGLRGVREKLREDSGYQILRGALVALLIFAGLGLAVSIIGLFIAETQTLAIAGVISSLGSIFSILILGVLLDIADALLAKID